MQCHIQETITFIVVSMRISNLSIVYFCLTSFASHWSQIMSVKSPILQKGCMLLSPWKLFYRMCNVYTSCHAMKFNISGRQIQQAHSFIVKFWLEETFQQNWSYYQKKNKRARWICAWIFCYMLLLQVQQNHVYVQQKTHLFRVKAALPLLLPLLPLPPQ